MNIAVIGTGYVGLVTGTCFAETGNKVTCVDINELKINKLKSGELTIYEPGLEVIFRRNLQHHRLFFTTSLEEGIKDASIIFLALPTPPGADGSADLSFILDVADKLSQIITSYKVIVDKSTVPVGTAEQVAAVLRKRLSADLFDVVSNPEFLREGVAVEDFMRPDRVVIGSDSKKAEDIMNTLYAAFVRQGNPIIHMDIRSAEMTKYAANSYLATRISFMNEIANLCEAVGADVDWVRKGMGSDTRIGKRFLFPGVGYGGSCFPKDVEALYKTAQDHDYPFQILGSVMQVNAQQKKRFAQKVSSYFSELSGKTFAIWGLAFKPNTDDIREAPALEIIQFLLDQGAKVNAYDPEAIANTKALFGDKVNFARDAYDALDNADSLLILTEWNAFRNPDFDRIKSTLKSPVIFDGRNVFDLHQMQALGFHYESIGRPVIKALAGG